MASTADKSGAWIPSASSSRSSESNVSNGRRTAGDFDWAVEGGPAEILSGALLLSVD